MKPNLLVLDEPTNHLDIETVEALSHSLAHFKGGVILVSHDERLINLVCKTLWLAKDKQVTRLDDMSQYKKMLAKEWSDAGVKV